jgi:hypothetical protein
MNATKERTIVQTVESSLVEIVGYDSENHDLYVKFNSGETYVYAEVHEDVYHEMVKAKSVGLYFIENVRDDYDATKVD